MKKYKLTDNTITITRNGVKITLHQIEALRDFANVKVGDKGGFIEHESNLSHDGTCWVYDYAWVYNDAYVSDHAEIRDRAEVYGYAKIYGSAEIYNYAKVYDNSEVTYS